VDGGDQPEFVASNIEDVEISNSINRIE